MIEALRENAFSTMQPVREMHNSVFELKQNEMQLRYEDETETTQILDLTTTDADDLSAILDDTSFIELLYSLQGGDNDPLDPYRLTHRLLSQEEIYRFLTAIDLQSATGLRDRSIIETLYSSGIRRAELIHLAIDDIDMANGMV